MAPTSIYIEQTLSIDHFDSFPISPTYCCGRNLGGARWATCGQGAASGQSAATGAQWAVGAGGVSVSRQWQLPISPSHGAAASGQSQRANPVQGRSTEHGFSVTGGDSISLVGSVLLVPRCTIMAVPPSSSSPFPLSLPFPVAHLPPFQLMCEA